MKLVPALILILIISVSLNFLPNIVFPGWRYLKYFGVIALIFAYILLSKRIKINKDLSPYIGQYFLPIFSFFLFFIFIETAVLGFIQNEVFFRALTMLVLWASFGFFIIVLLNKFYVQQHNIYLAILKLCKPYVFLSIAIIISSMLALLLILVDVIDPYNYSIPYFLGYEFTKEITAESDFFISENHILFPGYLSIVSPVERFLPVNLRGWSYEPHIATFFITPSIFLLHLYFKNIKYLFYVLYVIFFIGASSVTNLVALLLVFIAFIFSRIMHNKIFSFFKLIIFSFIVMFIFILLSHNLEIIDKIINFVLYKFSDKSTSADLSSLYMGHIISPSQLISGGGIFVIPDHSTYLELDVGLFGSIYYVSLFVFFIVGIIYLLLQKNVFHLSFGLALLYFFIHSLKLPMHLINYPFFMFMFFILLLNLIAVKMSSQRERGY
jgi:hypothetical protein